MLLYLFYLLSKVKVKWAQLHRSVILYWVLLSTTVIKVHFKTTSKGLEILGTGRPLACTKSNILSAAPLKIRKQQKQQRKPIAVEYRLPSDMHVLAVDTPKEEIVLII